MCARAILSFTHQTSWLHWFVTDSSWKYFITICLPKQSIAWKQSRNITALVEDKKWLNIFLIKTAACWHKSFSNDACPALSTTHKLWGAQRPRHRWVPRMVKQRFYPGASNLQVLRNGLSNTNCFEMVDYQELDNWVLLCQTLKNSRLKPNISQKWATIRSRLIHTTRPAEQKFTSLQWITKLPRNGSKHQPKRKTTKGSWALVPKEMAVTK